MTVTTLTGRSLAPDLARGFMLLAIALAHAPVFVSGAAPGVLDGVAAFLDHLLAHNQARPMFVFLFGYALGQLAYRHKGDWPSLKGLLRRRGRWLIVIGFAHGVLLVPLDIVAVYGLTLLVLAPLVRARDSVLCWTAALTLVPAALVVSGPIILAYAGAVPITPAEIMPADLGSHLLSGLQLWPFKTVLGTIDVVPGMLLGIWAARRRILDEPESHKTLLRRVTVICLGVALVGRLPGALLMAGAWTAPWPGAVVLAHTLTGYAGGVGLAALVGLVATRADRGRTSTPAAMGPGPLTTAMPMASLRSAGSVARRRRLPPLWSLRSRRSSRRRHSLAIAALGQRSLTFYLLQSVVFLVLFYPFTLDLGDDLGFAAASGIAIAIWAVSVPAADLMRRAGHRGPAELLLRRLVYR
ncbi:DUF418 domain-containing protein [Nonomuraea sp. NPDC049480]|uniref:DUF418 domain-containing protein n=1 Tax=Nonomuraea sp. NPDC049480 TaxID=3364353 RepID=UPI0037B888A3